MESDATHSHFRVGRLDSFPYAMRSGRYGTSLFGEPFSPSGARRADSREGAARHVLEVYYYV